MVAGVAAGLMYGLTLLPGLDLGDTASFQTLVTVPVLVPRHAYPLYFALGKLCLAVADGEPARALNLLSAVAGTLAIAAFARLAWHLTASSAAALWAALLLAGSYTFWSQALIAEVYTLEALLLALVLIAAVRWWHVPSAGRLASLYAVYALSFGNHLGMILLAPALAWLLVRRRATATLDPFSRRGIALAAALAAGGALQYLWNLYGLWALTAPRPGLGEMLAAFWFDVTKADWRETLIGTVPLNQWGSRLAMYWWDLRQQFGVAGAVVAAAGVVAIVRASRAIGAALLLAYGATFVFAFLYNVGDTHVFLLPSHQIVVLFAAAGIAVALRMAGRLPSRLPAVVTALLFVVPLWRIADTWPAVDRSGDRRADEFAAASLAGLTAANAIYVADQNWQTQNAVGYELTVHRPELPHVFGGAVRWHFPALVRRNLQLGRDVVLTAPAAESIAGVYGPLFHIEPDARQRVSTVAAAARLSRGTPYVLTVLTPVPGLMFDRERVVRAAVALSGLEPPRARYVAIAGVAGQPPIIRMASDRPFRTSARLPWGRVSIRLDGWLPFDTMRRAGFGHVIVNGRHALTIERGATFGAFSFEGQLTARAYEGGSFALQPRYRIPVLH